MNEWMMEGEKNIREAQRGQDRRALNVNTVFWCLSVDSWLRLYEGSLGAGRRLQ